MPIALSPLNDQAPLNDRARSRALTVALVSTGFGLLPACYVAAISTSVILWADLLRAATEFAAIVAAWAIARKIARTDRSHFNYGFGKLEQLGSTYVALALLLAAVIVAGAAFYRIIEPTPVTNWRWGAILALLSVIGNGAVWWMSARARGPQPSPILDSQYRLFRAKTFASAVVACSLGIGLFDQGSDLLVYSDAVGSLVIAGFLLSSSIALFASSTKELIDASLDEVLLLAVLRILIEHADDYRGFHGMRSRRGSEKIYLELALVFPPDMTIHQFTVVTERLRADLVAKLGEVEVVIIPSAA